jgi:hypothetical protein
MRFKATPRLVGAVKDLALKSGDTRRPRQASSPAAAYSVEADPRSQGGSNVNDESFDLRLTRGAVLRLAAAGAAGLALGVRSARAAPVRQADGVEAAARAFLASLSPAQRDRASFPFGGAERTRWHWTVPTSVPRHGLPLGQMSIRQRRVAFALLRASTSKAGYSKARDIMSLQGVLQRMSTGINDPFDADRYFVSVFGRPSDRAWGWRLEGHHLSRNFTIVGDTVVTEPFFLGAWPTRAGTAYRTIVRGERAMRREEDAAREIVLSVDGQLRRRVVFSPESLTDHVTQNAVRVTPLDPVGVLARDLPSAAQRRMLEIVRTYVANHPPATARRALDRVQRAGMTRIRFGWAGSLRPGRSHYYRLQGPTFLLEFDNSRNSGTHIHSVWRDFERDYGRHLL